ncbi:unnamed protein product [Lactuca saligna]|uniref:Uncharacterized protein n=1 Tax=Lactuca saligna TaxID=75948 RepID=A0AA36ELP3_LACSI|nr:unnamed protein product [Lactuca saligna]
MNDLADVEETKEEVEGVNELKEIERVMEEEILVWNQPKPKEDVKLTKPRASTTMIFEVFAFTTPKVEFEETIIYEDLGDKEEKRNSLEFTLDMMWK